MGAKITKRFNVDLLALPEYLEKQAGQGLYIKKVKSAWLVFEQGEPSDTIYKLVPVNSAGEYDQLKELEGWVNVLSIGEFVLISAPSGTPFNMVLDNDVMLIKLSFMRTMYVVRFFLAVLGLLFSVSAFFQYLAIYPWLSAVAALFTVVLLFFGTMEFLPLLHLQRSIKDLQKHGGR